MRKISDVQIPNKAHKKKYKKVNESCDNGENRVGKPF